MNTSVSSAEQATSKLVVHFINSIREVLATMASITVAIGKPSLKADPAPLYDVSGIIGFSGNFSGAMVLSFQTRTAIAIVKAFAGADIPPNSPDFGDAVGELANMIAGSAKKSFGAETSIGVPSVIIGKGHTIARLQGVPCVIIPCNTMAGDFALEVCIKPAHNIPTFRSSQQ
jgi:chemotaxis protein CheX